LRDDKLLPYRSLRREMLKEVKQCPHPAMPLTRTPNLSGPETNPFATPLFLG
jgi:hypothetical protein